MIVSNHSISRKAIRVEFVWIDSNGFVRYTICHFALAYPVRYVHTRLVFIYHSDQEMTIVLLLHWQWNRLSCWEVNFPLAHMCNLALSIHGKRDQADTNKRRIPRRCHFHLWTAHQQSWRREGVQLENFNVPHPDWDGPSRRTPNAAADQTLELVEGRSSR